MTEARPLDLKASDPTTGIYLWLVRDMMAHRDIDSRELARETGMSVYWVRDIVTGRFRNSYRPLENLARIEDAITSITDRRGGIPEACCSLTTLRRTRYALSDYVHNTTTGEWR